MLSDSGSDAETLQQLTINEHYAKAYARKKEREELANLKDKYGSDADREPEESDDSEDTEEDEDGEELTPAVDAAILRTLARIKRRDPVIYDAQKDVYEEERQRTKSSFTFQAKDKDKNKPLLLRQHIIHSNLKSISRSPSPEPGEPTHTEEQAALRKETISAFHRAVSGGSEDEDEDNILIPREKTMDEIEREQEEYRAFLQREVGEDIGGLVTIEESGNGTVEEEEQTVEEKTADQDKKKKKRRKKDKERKSKEEADHEFLMNYILNRGWVDKSTRHIPTYGEVTSSKSRKNGPASNGEEENEPEQVNIIGEAGSDDQAEDLDEEEFDEVAETFESSYNFRFEEPGADTIASHPREISSTVRRDENPRKAARDRKKQRKEEKLLQMREEVKRLKSLKMKEIREKLEQIGREGGKSADDEALARLDLEGDWDPEAHDRQMAGIYGEDEGEEGDLALEKPTWDDDIDIADVVPLEVGASAPSSKEKKKDKKKKKKKGIDEDEDGVGVDIDEMDADVAGYDDDDEAGPSNSNLKLNRKVLDEAMDDVYGLEFNDLVGEIPTRFKYTPVLPQTYGMTPVEILLADDADLNNVVGLRKIAPYRRDHGRTWDSHRNEKLREFRTKLGEKRMYKESVANGANAREGEGALSSTKRKGKKERQKAKLAVATTTEEEPSPGVNEDAGTRGGEPSAKKRKRRHKRSAQSESIGN